MRNPGVLPPFPAWEGVLATEIWDAGRTPDSTTYREGVDEVTKSITEGYGLVVPNFAPEKTVSWCTLGSFGFSPNCARALANPSCMAWRTYARISAACIAQIVVLDVVCCEASSDDLSLNSATLVPSFTDIFGGDHPTEVNDEIYGEKRNAEMTKCWSSW